MAEFFLNTLQGVAVIGVGCLFLAVIWIPWFPSPEQPKRRRTDKVARTNEILASAAYHREQLQAQAHEMAELHGYDWNSDEADQLESVVWAGVPYEEAMNEIMRRFR